jgi:HSP20 family molecular chaperone IbpA
MTHLIKSHSLSPVPTFLDQDISKLFNLFFPDFHPEFVKISTEGYPIASVYIDDIGNLKYTIAVTDFNKDEIEVLSEGNSLVIIGEKFEREDDKHWRLVEGRVKKAAFKKRFSVPARMDLSKIEVTLKNGLLSIFVPISEQAKPQKLSIIEK